MTTSRIAFAALLLCSALLPASADARGGGGGHGGRGGFSHGGHHGGWSAPRMTHRTAPMATTRGAHYAPGYRPMQMRSGAQWRAGAYGHHRDGRMMSGRFHGARAAHAWAGPRGHGYRRHAHARFAASSAFRHHGFRSLRYRTSYAPPIYGYGSTLPYGYADSYEGYDDTAYYADSAFRPGFLAFLAGGGASFSSAGYAAAPVQQDYFYSSYRPRCSCY